MDVIRTFLTSTLAIAAGCAPRAASPIAVPARTLVGSDGAAHALVDPAAKLTVIEFFSAHCPCQSVHDTRLRDLAAEYAARGVAFVAVDSERGAGVEADRAQAEQRGYSYPILVDADGAVARAVRAGYATYTVVVDREGRVVFAGGIDSDRTHLTDDAVPYLREALDDALAGRAVRRPEAKALGCALAME
jgi:peroxiredoxin